MCCESRIKLVFQTHISTFCINSTSSTKIYCYLLLTIMNCNCCFRFIGISGRENLKEKWKQLADELNSMGGANKSPDEWKKCWEDMK